ncbi:hypothetical protein [Aliiroseovarius sp. S2029]|nr:hypothetical protein [Aliiroseovarius sp. S2029]
MSHICGLIRQMATAIQIADRLTPIACVGVRVGDDLIDVSMRSKPCVAL